MIALRCICAAAVLAGSAVACHSDTAPDLSRLYASGMEQARTPPVILIPGVLGSRLFDKHKRSDVWPGSTLHLLAVPNKIWYYPLTRSLCNPSMTAWKRVGFLKRC